MGKKLKVSELKAILKEKGYNADEIDDILDDESGKGLSEFKSGLTAKEKEASEAAAKLQEAEGNLGKWNGWWGQIPPEKQQQMLAVLQGPGTKAEKAEAMAELNQEIWKDPLYSPIAPHFQTLHGGYENMFKAMQMMVQDYAAAKQQFTEAVQDLYLWRMGRDHDDFSTNKEAIQKYAQEHRIPTWEAAYQGWKGSRLPEEVKKAEQIAREAALKEKTVQGEAARVDMGSQSPAGGAPGGQDGKKDYEGSWANLAKSLESAGTQGLS